MGAPERVAQRYVRNEQVTVSAIAYVVEEMERASTLLVDHTLVAGVLVTLKNAWISRDGNTITIKDSGFNASVNNIDIVGEGGQDIEGDPMGATINLDGCSLTLQSDGTALWVV